MKIWSPLVLSSQGLPKIIKLIFLWKESSFFDVPPATSLDFKRFRDEDDGQSYFTKVTCATLTEMLLLSGIMGRRTRWFWLKCQRKLQSPWQGGLTLTGWVKLPGSVYENFSVKVLQSAHRHLVGYSSIILLLHNSIISIQSSRLSAT